MTTPSEILKVSAPRKREQRYGVVEQYKDYRRLGKLKLDKPTWRKIVLAMADEILAELFEGKAIELPHQMGRLAIRKKERKIVVGKDGKPKVNTPINWKATIDLWSENEEAHQKKILVRYEDKEIYAIEWTKRGISFLYAERFCFKPARKLRRTLAKLIKENGSIDCERLDGKNGGEN